MLNFFLFNFLYLLRLGAPAQHPLVGENGLNNANHHQVDLGCSLTIRFVVDSDTGAPLWYHGTVPPIA